MSIPNNPLDKHNPHQTFDNAWHGDDFLRIAEAFTELGDVLHEHCGPYATFAAIGTRNRVVDNADEHTKDGIHIVECLLSNKRAPARYAARMTRFIGKTIDSRCHDGTTTAMLFFCRAAAALLTRRPSDRTELYNYTTAITSYFNSVLDYVDTLKMTVDGLYRLAEAGGYRTTKAKVRKALAFHQAMLSSKGDVEMATAIAEVIENTPIKLYGQYIRDTSLHETQERIVLDTPPYQLTIRAGMGSINAYNINLGTEFRAEDCVVFGTDEELINGSLHTDFLNALISISARDEKHRGVFGIEKSWEEYSQGKRLIIVSPNLSDDRLMNNIMVFNRMHPDNPICWFNTSPDGILREIFNSTLHAIASTPTTDQVKVDQWMSTLIHGVTVSYRKDTLRFEDLYRRDKKKKLHPNYLKPGTFVHYDTLRKGIEDILEFAQKHPSDSPMTSEQIDFILVMYRYLCCQQITTVKLGGTVHENKSMRTVFDDAMGSALSAVDDGVVFGGYGHILKNGYDRGDTAMVPIIIQDHALSEVLAATLDAPVRTAEDLANTIERKTDMLVVDRALGEIRVDRLENHLTDFLNHSRRPFLMQPYLGFIEQFTRFADILPKMVATTILIDMGHLENGGE